MITKEITDVLGSIYPESAALEWDNPGLIVGRNDAQVDRILVTLDVTGETVSQAIREKVQLIVSHHPVIFGQIRRINDSDFLGRRLLDLIENGINCYAMHTNFDILEMGKLGEKQLGLVNTIPLDPSCAFQDEPCGIGCAGDLEKEMTLKELSLKVKEACRISDVRCYGDPDMKVSCAAVSSGSGRSMVRHAIDAGVPVLVTGDIDHHTALDALASGLSIIDAGHYGTENCFIEHMTKRLAELFPQCTVIAAKQQQPYTLF